MRNRICLLASLFLLLLTACGAEPSQESGPQAEETPPAEEETKVETPREAVAAYHQAIRTLELQGVYPNGTSNLGMGDDGTGARTHYVDRYAVCDVDGDGWEELVISHTEDFSAGMFLSVCGWDSETGALYEELLAFPTVTFYTGGVALLGASHNHTYGELFPYDLARHGGGRRDCYEIEASVHSLSRDYVDEADYPAQADASGTGQVYFINGPERDPWSEEEPLDEAEYLAWRDGCLAGAREIKLNWQDVEVPFLPAR